MGSPGRHTSPVFGYLLVEDHSLCSWYIKTTVRGWGFVYILKLDHSNLSHIKFRISNFEKGHVSGGRSGDGSPKRLRHSV